MTRAGKLLEKFNKPAKSKARKILEKLLKEDAKISDEYLDAYVKDPMYGILSEKEFNLAKQDYPLDKPTKVYRGLNFATKEDYEEFIKKTSNGKHYNSNAISSWSPDKATAKNFAVTRPSYLEFASKETLDLLAKKKLEKITGFRGVILETTAKPEFSVDLRKFGGKAESEILINSDSSLPIKIIADFTRFEDEFDNTKISDFLSRYKTSEFKEKAVIWLLSTQYEHLDDESFETLYKMFRSTDLKQQLFDYGVDDNQQLIIPEFKYRSFIIRFIDKLSNTVFVDRLRKLWSKPCKDLIKGIQSLRKQYPDYMVWLGNSEEISKVMKVVGLKDEWDSVISSDDTFKKEYQKLSGDDKIRDINKLKGRDKEKAMDNLIKEFEMLFGKKFN